MLYSAGAACVLWLRGKPHSELPCLFKMEGGEGGSCKASAQAQPKVRRQGQTAAPKAQRAGPSAEQKNLSEGWNRVVRGGRVVKATTKPPNYTHPNPPSSGHEGAREAHSDRHHGDGQA